MTEDENMIKTIKHEMADQLIKEFLQGMGELGFTKEEMMALIHNN